MYGKLALKLKSMKLKDGLGFGKLETWELRRIEG